MNVVVLGATGMLGSRIVAELALRGHNVTRGLRLGATGGLEAVAHFDPRDPLSIARAAAGHDAVISALGGSASGDPRLVADAARALLAAAEAAGSLRLVVVGGAGSLRNPDGTRLIDSPTFPDAWRPAAQAQVDALGVYRSYDGPVDWTYLSPSHLVEPGQRTGDIVLGGDEVLRDDSGRSYVSAEDFAVALVDELEHPAHSRLRFTVRTR